MMKFPTEWKNNIHVPNHQPAIVVMLNFQRVIYNLNYTQAQ